MDVSDSDKTLHSQSIVCLTRLPVNRELLSKTRCSQCLGNTNKLQGLHSCTKHVLHQPTYGTRPSTGLLRFIWRYSMALTLYEALCILRGSTMAEQKDHKLQLQNTLS